MADRPVLDRFRLDGQVAVVTGASSGLGVAFARALAEAGADLALGARRVDRLADTATLVEETGRRALTHGTDVADPQSCTDLVALAMEEFGHVDILVNSAGGIPRGTLLDIDEERWRRAWDLKVFGCINLTREMGVNLAGVTIIMDLLQKLREIQEEKQALLAMREVLETRLASFAPRHSSSV